MIWICYWLLASSAWLGNHKFYVSHTQLEQKGNKVEATIKIFYDDLETALRKQGHSNVRLNSGQNETVLDSFIYLYVKQKLAVFPVGYEALRFIWIGKEYEADVCWIYLEATAPTANTRWTIRNKCLFECFEDQQNLVDFRNGAKRKSAILTKQEAEVMFYFN